MPNKLKDLKITSTDLVNAGANPDAHIRLFKRNGTPDDSTAPVGDGQPETLLQKAIAAIMGVFGKTTLDGTVETVLKDAKTFDEEMNRERLRSLTNEAWNMAYALSDSWSSIICDSDLSEDDRRSMMLQSLDEFAVTARNAIPNWAAGENAEKNGAVMKSKAQEAAFDAYWAQYAKSDSEPPATGDEPPATESEPTGDNHGGDNNVGKSHNPNQKEETDTMKIDKSKMTPEEQATLAEFEKKYGTAEPDGSPATATGDGGVAKGAEQTTAPAGGAGAAPELHPEVKKALDDNAALATRVEELTKSLEIKDLTAVAKKYELIGKKPEELAGKLYGLKKAGGTAYDDYVALLDEQVTLVEKGGLFGELGSNATGGVNAGGELNMKADEIRKSNAGMSEAEAFAKAYETYPDLAAQYEQTYRGRA